MTGKIWLCGLLCLAFSVRAEGVFGLNKVQYRDYDWKRVQTAHFDLYYYSGGDSLAAFAARRIERLYEENAAFLDHRLLQRIPIIMHNTHAQFSQTNVIRFPIPEAVGGFTEVFKNRIVIPFDGNYASFEHVLQHELIHAMMFDLVSGGRRGYSTAAKLGNTPLWLSEGLAEYGSLGWEISSEPYLLDAVSSGYLRNPAEGLWGFMAYKGGQSFLFFIESAWGKGTVAKILRSVAQGLPFEIAFLRATRVSLEEAGDIWLREARRIYWPELGQRQYAKSVARAMTDHRKDQSYYNVQPAISPNGQRIAFFSDRGNREAVLILDTESEKVTRVALEGGHVAAHESFHAFQSSLSWAGDNRHLALVSKQGGRDVIHLVDVDRSRVVCEIAPGDLEAVSSPSISPDGNFLIISGQRRAQMDLYRIDLPSSVQNRQLPKRLEVKPKQLTNNHWTEENPRVSPSGRWVAFQSNRDRDSTDRFVRDKTEIYVLDLQNLSVRRVTHSRWSSHDPAWAEDDSALVYVSNRSGVPNLYWQEVFGDSLWALTNLAAGVASPSLAADASSLVFSLFENGGWDVFLMKDPWHKRRAATLPRTRFVEFAEDTSGQTVFYAPVVFENLKTWRDSIAMDSLEKQIRDRLPAADTVRENTPPEPPDEQSGFFLDSPPKKTVARAADRDSTGHKTDSLNAPGAEHRDSVRTASRQTRFRELGVDTSGIFLPGGSAPAFHEDGSLKSIVYKPIWSLDQAVAVAGFSSYSGVGGQGALTFSDLMGDQEINLWFFGGGRLDNINVFAQYNYLPMRLDASVSGFHNYREGNEEMTYARYLALRDSVSRDPAADSLVGLVPYGDRSLGVNLDFSWPFSLYSRLDFGSSLTWRTRTWFMLDEELGIGGSAKEDTAAKPQKAHTWELAAGWSFDNAEWGVSGPVLGQRLWSGLRVVPPAVLQNNLAYWRWDMDLRQYFRAFKRYTLALRVAGGMSEPIPGYKNPHRYLVGGDDWTINWHFSEKHWKGTQEDVFFSTWETPLRGFRYHDFAGTRMALANAEFRFPFIEQLSFGWPIPLTISRVTGVLFTDFGGTWEQRDFLRNRGMGLGWGWRLNLGIFVLRYTRGWSVNEFSTVRRAGYTYWSLGAEF